MEYGVTEKGFVLKRMDTILEEIHEDLTEGFGTDTRLLRPSFLDTLVTTFSGQIADLWETAQDSYYSKYPATATGINLDNAVQYGGIRRNNNKKTCYPLHCTGEDGIYIGEEARVASNTLPEIRLLAASEFQITRESFNMIDVTVAVTQKAVYTITLNGNHYNYYNERGTDGDILQGLKQAIDSTEFGTSVVANALHIEDTIKSRSNLMLLSDNLTTSSVTTIANFYTESYGKVTLPYGVITKMVNNIAGFETVNNWLSPTYGRTKETDIELRQSYIAKSALRSNTMIDSIVAELLNNVPNVESASGYENDTDTTDARGMPPHSIEIVVEGGDNSQIAQAILRRKAGGIQTHGSVAMDVLGKYGESIPIRFNRPEYLYTWLKLVLHGNANKLPINYVQLTKQSLLEDGVNMEPGENLLTQLLTEGIYSDVAGITFIDIHTAYSMKDTYVPIESDYQLKNIIATSRQRVLIDEARIEVTFDADS